MLACISCGSPYRSLQKVEGTGNVACLDQFRPSIKDKVLYNTSVDVLNHHFSGLLLFKKMENEDIRIVFTNEMGFKFFDFAFDKEGRFTKYFVTPKMDKKAVVKTLQKDFSMILMLQAKGDIKQFKNGDELISSVNWTKGKFYYITDSNCTELKRIENVGKGKPVVVITMKDYQDQLPGTIVIDHKKFKFNISSQRIIENVSK